MSEQILPRLERGGGAEVQQQRAGVQRGAGLGPALRLPQPPRPQPEVPQVTAAVNINPHTINYS